MDNEENKETVSETEVQPTDEKSKPSALIFGLIVIAVVVLAAGYMLIKSNKSSSAEESMEAQKGTQEESLIPPSNSTPENQAQTESMSQEQTTGQTIDVEGGMFYFKPNEIRVKKDQPVTINFTSKEGNHDFVIDGLNVKSDRISAGDSTTIKFTPDKTGTFEFYCSVSNHKQMGMKGNLIVE